MKFQSTAAVAAIVVAISLATAGVGCAQELLPRPAAPFKGHIGPTVQDSTLDFPPGIKAPGGAPNILLILTSI